MRKLSLTTFILIGLVLGVLTGVFVGERAEILDPIGNGFIRLLQMAVLPYFIVALPLGFGRLSYEEAKLTGARLALFSVVLWALAIGLVVLLPLMFPQLQSASFFSHSMVEPAEEVDFVELYIPANPFSSLSQAVIPGVVVFGVALGIALIGVPNKQQLLTVLDSLANALGRITGFVVKLTPIGVFALAASAAGTMTLEDLSRLQVYLVAYTIGAMLLAFWLVPMLVASLTPFSYGDVLRATRDPLVTGFTTGNLLVVLAMLADNCKQLFKDQEERSRRHAESVVDVALPIAFTFPNLGVVLLLLFIPFAGWFTGSPVALSDYPKLSVLGFFSFFGSVEIGLPFVLQQLRIPTDMFRLHVVTLVYIGRLATLLAVMHLAGLAILSAAGNAGWLRFRPKGLATFAVASTLLLAVSIGGGRWMLRSTVDQVYSKDRVLTGMRTAKYTPNGGVHREPPEPIEGTDQASPLDLVRQRGELRVGYDPEGLPFSFFNDRGELVGLDIEMTQALAEELGVKAVYYPYDKQAMAESLNGHRQYDLLVGGLFATTRRVEKMRFSDPYLDLHLSLLVPDHRKEEFSSLKNLRRKGPLRIGVLERPYFGARIQQSAPNAEIVLLNSPRPFFEGESDLDALVMSAEAGSAWTLLYPNYTVVMPSDAQLTVSVGYPMPLDGSRLENVVSRWIDLKRKDGTITALYDHWIEGKSAQDNGPRWNVLTDVLGWGQVTPADEAIQTSQAAGSSYPATR
ncbi:cation:dicarboxylase symporter family transporter [Aeoliella sp. ICT_H6.2]|uniref:Cation:dicarboxylase symporter family transporter n=1 Tax=Aeoliella straminimaris TaxID=2954799 RepID=A0A9X2F955_9BACT|nr:cation:dicarboxylase symporter family transporter [Aeoliella straminimaris]MCO6043943.1 cation:dicarboxylase symporter family transporter [Aeoliella straminimaris]